MAVSGVLENVPIDHWVVGLVKNLLEAIKRSLSETPTGIPDILEFSATYRGTSFKVSIEFDQET